MNKEFKNLSIEEKQKIAGEAFIKAMAMENLTAIEKKCLNWLNKRVGE